MINSLRKKLDASPLARNTLWMFLGQGLRLAIQGVYFVLLARSLGVTHYGAFVGTIALVGILAPFATVGFGSLLIKNVARDHSQFPLWWGNTLVVSAVSGTVLVGLALAVGRWLLPATIPARLILMTAVADLLAARFSDAASQAFQAAEKMKWTANINILISATRLIGAVGAALVWSHPTALQWSYLYCTTSIISAIISVSLVNRWLGKPRPVLGRIWGELVEGFHFSASLSAQTVYNDMDKAMLAHYSTLDATGIYAAAYRLIDVSFVPVRSLLYAAYPGLFRVGGDGIRAAVAYVKRLLRNATAYALAVWIGLVVAAPLVPHILGDEYSRTVEALRWLAFLPILRTFHIFYSDALTGSGYQGLRMVLQVIVAVFNVLINLWLIPAYSWRGAVWSSLLSDLLLMILVLSTASYLCRQEDQKTVVAPALASR